jgi:hypothetical protein
MLTTRERVRASSHGLRCRGFGFELHCAGQVSLVFGRSVVIRAEGSWCASGANSAGFVRGCDRSWSRLVLRVEVVRSPLMGGRNFVLILLELLQEGASSYERASLYTCSARWRTDCTSKIASRAALSVTSPDLVKSPRCPPIAEARCAGGVFVHRTRTLSVAREGDRLLSRRGARGVAATR